MRSSTQWYLQNLIAKSLVEAVERKTPEGRAVVYRAKQVPEILGRAEG